MRGASFVVGSGLGSFDLPPVGAAHSRSEQSRINGARSRGPVTEAGKAASSRNALKHGLCSKALLLPGEDPAEFENFVADFCQELSAEGTVQTTLVVRAAELMWKLRRLPAVEGAILQSVRRADGEADVGSGGMGDVLHQLVGKEQDGILLRLQRYETRLERSLHGCLREVRLLKKDAVGSFGTGAVGSFGDLVGRALPAEESAEQLAGSVVQGFSGGQCPPYNNAVGSFGTPTHAYGQPSVGAREGPSVVEAAPPARGPSAARQDDISAGVRLEAGAMGRNAVGSFGKTVPAALRKAAATAAPGVSPWVRSVDSGRATA